MGEELSMRLGQEVTVEAFCDHHQAICADELDDIGPADAWNEESALAGLALWEHGFAIGTERGWDMIPLTFALTSDRPHLDLEEWDHAVEGGVRLRSGRLVVHGPSENHDDAPRLLLAPGNYSLIVLGTGLSSVAREEHSMEGNDRYRVVLWPGSVLPRRVLRQGLHGS